MSRPQHLQCVVCGKQQPYEPFVAAICKHCESQWLEGRYDFDAFKREILRGLPGRPLNMWRYQDVLPLADPAALEPDEDGFVKGRAEDGTPIKAKIRVGGKSLARRLMEEEAARKKEVKSGN